ncbi:hypothetical protein Taro_015785 [Colocasia esculenta]|uniref:Uncharacterized protein n=1 Tax=Colocasia esculenta TaxID=4460 RepID=A0A843ULU2_COLES|nr:hypothetical protein [Colocasia esculenta]
MHQCLMSQRDSRQRRAENNAEISEELSGRLSRRGMRDNDDETGSEDSDPELTEAVERERAARLRGKAPVRSGSTDAAPHKAGPMDNYMHAYRMRTGTYSDTQLQYAVGRVSLEKQPEIVEDTEEQLEPARYSESDSRPVTPRMVKPPPSLRRTMSGIYMTERANAVARDDPAIEKMKQIYGKYGQDSQGQYGQDSQGHYGHHLGYGHYAHEPEFQFQPLPANSNYDSVSSSHARDSSPYSDSGFLSIQQPFTPKGIQRGMNDLATSLFGYSEYSEYKNPLYGFQGQQPYDEGEGSSGYYPS